MTSSVPPQAGQGPVLIAPPADRGGTGLVLIPAAGAVTEGPAGLPAVWAGPVPAGGLDPGEVTALLAAARPCALLPEHGRGWFGRPGLSGHRLASGGGRPASGLDWSPLFRLAGIERDGPVTVLSAADETAGLRLTTEAEPVPGGAIRVRHTVCNTRPEPYVVDSLEVVFPLPAVAGEVLDFTGRQTAERIPQRHPVGDGLWLREGRRGHTGHDSATVMVAGEPGFGFGAGEVYGLHVAWSGNTVHRVERLPSSLLSTGGVQRLVPAVTTIGGGELLLPGEVALAEGEEYRTPWVYLAASRDGLDALAAQFHGFARSLPAHPATPRPVNLNVWEAVYFKHDLSALTALADLAAEVGAERYVLDDGWFRGRRSDHSGLGDWQVDEAVWPDGLDPLIDRVRDRGLQFGLWIEPEMVNPDSALYREHPDWILSAGGRVPPLQRNQLVLDLARPEVAGYLFDQIDALLSRYPVSYVKWDCNRDVIDAGSGPRGGAPAAHARVLALYALLDRLRAKHPGVEWESCAAGGGRIDLAIAERCQRFWPSDMTDALARQQIQRWTGQLLPPEYLGTHVSAPFSHQTGRHMPLALRCATALFGHLGIEWDLTRASGDELSQLAAWIELYKRHRGLIHSGRTVRVDTGDEGAWLHGVVAADQSAALLCYVQLDQPRSDQALPLRVPGLDPAVRYRVTEVTPGQRLLGPAVPGPADPALRVAGSALAGIGVAVPPQRPLAAAVLLVQAAAS